MLSHGVMVGSLHINVMQHQAQDGSNANHRYSKWKITLPKPISTSLHEYASLEHRTGGTIYHFT